MIKKIPQKALTKVNAKGDFKSSNLIKVSEAYHKTFTIVKGTLNHFNQPTPNSYEGFVTLYFPDEKAISTSQDKQYAKELIALKKATSVAKVAVLNQKNPWFMTFLDLSLMILEDQDLLSVKILKSFKSEFN